MAVTSILLFFGGEGGESRVMIAGKGGGGSRVMIAGPSSFIMYQAGWCVSIFPDTFVSWPSTVRDSQNNNDINSTNNNSSSFNHVSILNTL